MESKQSSSTTRTHMAAITFSSAQKIQTNPSDAVKEIDIVKLILQREEFIRHLERHNEAVLEDEDVAKRAKNEREAVEDENNNKEVAKQTKKELEGVVGTEESAPAPEIDKDSKDNLRLLLSMLANTRESTLKLVHVLAKWQDTVGAPFRWFVLTRVSIKATRSRRAVRRFTQLIMDIFLYVVAHKFYALSVSLRSAVNKHAFAIRQEKEYLKEEIMHGLDFLDSNKTLT